MKHFISASCGGEVCRCGTKATHKIAEEIPHDDPSMTQSRVWDDMDNSEHILRIERAYLNEYEIVSYEHVQRVQDVKARFEALTPDECTRHELTAYVCCSCFTALLGAATGCPT